MDMTKFKDSWRGTQAENKFNRLIIAGLLVLVLILAGSLAAKNTTVVMVPPTLEERGEISAGGSSPEILESWGFYMAYLLGNVTPGNAEYLAKNISRHLSSRMYQPVIDAINAQVKQVKEERITTTFSANEATFHPETGTVVVTGEAVTRGLRGEPEEAQRTYEMKFIVRNYQVLLDDIKVYRGNYNPGKKQ
jgi:conjugal transfer pilus assembly protein TraE